MGLGLGILAGSVISGFLGSKSAKKASDAQVEATRLSTEEQRRQYDTTRQDFAPWRAAGVEALGQMQDPNANFMASPDYNFRVNEGNRNMENRFSVGGGGGNAMRALAEYNSNLAGNEFGNWWNRQSNLAGLGQNATGATAQAGMNSANNISQNYLAAGNARASGLYNSANAMNSAVQGGIQNWLYAKGQGWVG